MQFNLVNNKEQHCTYVHCCFGLGCLLVLLCIFTVVILFVVFYCVVSRLFTGWFAWDCIPPPFVILYLNSWGLIQSCMFAVILAHFICCFFFIPLCQRYILLLLLLLYFSPFWSASIECLSVWPVPTFVVLFYFVYLSIKAGAHG